MPALILHLLAGLLAGAIFRVQMLLILMLAVLVEGGVVLIMSSASASLEWLLVSLSVLQFGYLGGIYLRSLLEQPGVTAHPDRRSPENRVRDVWRS